MKNKNILFFITLTLFVISCEKEIKYKGDEINPKITVSAILETDSIPVINIGKSIPTIGTVNNDSELKNFTVVFTDLTTNQIFSQFYESSLTTCKFNTLIKEGHTYKISVSNDELGTVSSQASILGKTEIIDWDTTMITSNINNEYSPGQSQMSRKEISISFKDKPGKSYYAISVTNSDNLNLISSDLSVKNGDKNESIIYLNDDLFDGQNKQLKFDINPSYTFDQNGNTKEASYYVNLFTIDEATYRYYLSISNSKYSDNFMSEPVIIYNNITNGIGIMGSIARHTIKIE